jgi:hypothetical protein
MSGYFALVKADVDLLIRGVNRVVSRLPAVNDRAVTNAEIEAMRKTAQQVQEAALYYRPGARCLPQAVAIARLLRGQGEPVTLVIAVRRFPFAAHAWVECNERVLTDRQDVRLEFIPLLRNEPKAATVGATA